MHKKESTKELFRKSKKRLLVPYLIFLLFGLLLDFIIRFINNENLTVILIKETFFCSKSAVVASTAASWFLLSLFAVRLLFNYLEKKVSPFILTGGLLFATYGIYLIQCYVGSFHMQYGGYHESYFIPDWMGNICHGLLLYCLGYYLKEKQFDKVVFIPALLLFVLKFFIPAGINFRYNDAFDGPYLLAVIYGIAGCIVFNNLFKRYVNINIKMFTYMGRNSMLYYLIHYPVMYTTKKLFWFYVEKYDISICYFLLSFVVTAFLILAEFLFRNKRMQFIIGG